MNKSRTNTAPWQLDKFLRSDLLPHLSALIQAFPSLRPLLPELLQVRIVIDANIVQKELRWRLKYRRKPTARSALQEVLDCEVLVAYAPHFLEDEIAEHTPRLARETNRSIDDVVTEWHEFRRRIAFYTARSKATVDVSRTDPDDTAYIDTIEEIAAQAIYTRDRDFLRANVPVILVTIEDDLQRYARSSSVRIGVMVGSSLSVGFGLQALLALSQLILRLVQAVRRLPPAAQAVIVTSIAVAVAHPKSRAKFVQLWRSLNRALRPTVWEAIIEGMHQFVEATATADTSFDAVQQAMPATKKTPLLSHARAVCLAARKPLTTHEIVKRAIAGGYKPRFKGSEGYLRRKLRTDGRFVEMDAGWIICGEGE